MHIPPGLNGYQTAESVKAGGPAITFWQPELTSRFLQLVGEYRSLIQAVFAGHTHMDDFRVISRDGQPALFIKIAPAVSPIYGNNPSFQVYQYDRDSGVIQNYQTYFLTNLARQLGKTLPHQPVIGPSSTTSAKFMALRP